MLFTVYVQANPTMLLLPRCASRKASAVVALELIVKQLQSTITEFKQSSRLVLIKSVNAQPHNAQESTHHIGGKFNCNYRGVSARRAGGCACCCSFC